MWWYFELEREVITKSEFVDLTGGFPDKFPFNSSFYQMDSSKLCNITR
ncbi:hypothetical protein tinsulaeT_35570 [Thalassotalea insulae]|uniref:Uncharacterized protein n=1 Tax=Thalassotalea insulae TaxID=2056778 RepID=A0ABQ6GWH5_9GAMM|nr:hypothetical protein tinsulaeT_35570 [Thalassotalea insulae]